MLQMGGPGTTGEVEGFLYSLLSDVRVTGIPFAPLRRFVARWIARSRAPKVVPNYEKIGGGSPILARTKEQAWALQKELAAEKWPVAVAMRYTAPRSGAAVADLSRKGVTHVVALPLYPQFCRATSESSIVDFRLAAESAGLEVAEVGGYPAADGFIDAMSDEIKKSVRNMRAPTLVFSAHSIPARAAKGGDPYPGEVKKTVEALAERLPRGLEWHLAYQSRVGPVEWLRPYLDECVRELGASGVRDLVVVPISFVSEHIETLYELDHEVRGIAVNAGVERFERAPAVGTHPRFIGALAEIARNAVLVAEG